MPWCTWLNSVRSTHPGETAASAPTAVTARAPPVRAVVATTRAAIFFFTAVSALCGPGAITLSIRYEGPIEDLSFREQRHKVDQRYGRGHGLSLCWPSGDSYRAHPGAPRSSRPTRRWWSGSSPASPEPSLQVRPWLRAPPMGVTGRVRVPHQTNGCYLSRLVSASAANCCLFSAPAFSLYSRGATTINTERLTRETPWWWAAIRAEGPWSGLAPIARRLTAEDAQFMGPEVRCGQVCPFSPEGTHMPRWARHSASLSVSVERIRSWPHRWADTQPKQRPDGR